jgi:hypothetical protein
MVKRPNPRNRRKNIEIGFLFWDRAENNLCILWFIDELLGKVIYLSVEIAPYVC